MHEDKSACKPGTTVTSLEQGWGCCCMAVLAIIVCGDCGSFTQLQLPWANLQHSFLTSRGSPQLASHVQALLIVIYIYFNTDAAWEAYKSEMDLFQIVSSSLGILIVPSILPDSSTLKVSFTCRCFCFAENISASGHSLRLSPTKANYF